MKILLLGCEGRLGKAIQRLHPEVIGFGKSKNIRDEKDIAETVFMHRPDIVINCAALTNVEYCESHKDECWDVNCYAVEKLLAISERIGANLIHFSSDYALNPVNEYGYSKRESENIIGNRGLVIRTDLYDEHTYLVNKLLYTQEKVEAYSDKFFNPISMYGLVAKLFEMLNMKGLYNIATREKISMLEFGLRICGIFNLDRIRVIPALSDEDVRGVKRPKEMYLEPYNDLGIDDDLRSFKYVILPQ